MKNFSKIINRDKENLKWSNRNYFYIISLLVLIAWICCYFFYDKIFPWVCSITEVYNASSGQFVYNSWCIILQSFLANLSIIMLLPICFYFERKYGSIKLLILLILSIPLSNICSWGCAARLSALSFFITALFFVDFLFDVKYYKKHKIEIIFPIILICICILFMCIDINPFSIGLFPRLLYDVHLFPFIAGVCTGFIIKLIRNWNK